MFTLPCEDVWRCALLNGELFGTSSFGGFFAERGFFFFERLTLFEESVAVPPVLKFIGGDDGGVVNNVGFCACGVVVFLGRRRLLRGPLGVGGVGD